MTTHNLGDPVSYDSRLVRKVTFEPGALDRTKTWVSVPLRGEYAPASVPAVTRTGIVVGVRTIADGTASWGGYDDPIEFRATLHKTAYLVAFDIRRNPDLVLPEDIRSTPTKETT